MSSRVLVWNSNALIYAQPEIAGTPEGTPISITVDANLNVYTQAQDGDISCTDVNGLTLWTLTPTQLRQLFVDAGAAAPLFPTNQNVWTVGDGAKLIFTATYVPAVDRSIYVGIADLNATGEVAVPVLTNYVQLDTGLITDIGPTGFWEMDGINTLLMTTTIAGVSSDLQWWLIPSVAAIEAGTYKGTHPGCTGTLDADQAPSFWVDWTNSAADAINESSNVTVQDGTVHYNGIGFLASVSGAQRYYMVVPRAWMENGTSGIAISLGAVDGAATYIDLTAYGNYPGHVWPALATIETVTNALAPTNVTATDFLSGSTPTIPWSDEWTRIYDGGANDGWLASYGGKPFIIYEAGVPVVFFAIIDGNPTYSATIGTGQRVWYARVRGYRWTAGAFREITPANGIVLRQGDLGVTDYTFDFPMTQNIFVYDGVIYFQIGQWDSLPIGAESGSVLTRFGYYLNLRRPRTTVAIQYHPLD